MRRTREERQGDLEFIQEGRPFIRATLAFLVYITRAPIPEGQTYHRMADFFLNDLEGELRADIARRK